MGVVAITDLPAGGRVAIPTGHGVPCALPANGGRGVQAPQNHTRFAMKQERFFKESRRNKGKSARQTTTALTLHCKIDPLLSSGHMSCIGEG